MARKDYGPYKKKGKAKKKKEKQEKGFSTLNQVTGVPKSYTFHSSIPVEEPKVIKSDRPTCPICGKVVEDVSSSFLDKEGNVIHFDCVLSMIKEREMVKDDEKLSYVGKGNFGIFRMDEEGHYHLERTIPFENEEENSRMKAYIGGLKE